ncbi:hypothetical protein AruPA_18875 [Acidiphilium sp. PA]|uniref:hypothetical protein n=1 Tax=Acidiphilium sp. PA TaxID=2871705 RepID=UPI002244D00B|nr:hypothetical protein [Acidiphilium sp. PA]MCW8309100.1 hypothetical protein [Acidiphilium sp. PA]
MIGRRALLAGVAMAPAVGRAAVQGSFADRLVGAMCRQLDALPPGAALLASYPDLVANAAFARFAPANDQAAYTYDNALAGLALLAGGHALHAARIADAFVLAQAHDPNYSDGRLRNAYRAGPVAIPVALPGWWDGAANHWAEDPYQVGSETGPIAWAILLWTALRDAGVNSDRYDEAAGKAADWIVVNCRAARGFSGGVFGFPPQQDRLSWVSTEQNTDCAVAFGRLRRRGAAAHAAGFVRAMRDPARGLFDAGLTPAGGRNALIAADANLWPYLAGLGDAGVIAPVLATLGWPRAHPAGIGFSAASQGIWTEGTAFAALALRRAGEAVRAGRFLATVRAEAAPDGAMFTTPAEQLATGLRVGPGADAAIFNYYRVPALAPAAWAALAMLGVNPLGR